MAVRDGLFVAPSGGTGTSPTEARLALAGLVAAGGPGGGSGGGVRAGVVHGPGSPGQVTGTTATSPPTYSVAAGVFVLQRDAVGGAYLCSTDGPTTVETTAPPASNSRWDLVWVRQQDAELGDPAATAVLGVTQGTAAASPSKPYGSVPAGALVLAEALVPSGITNTQGATITNVAPWTTTRGGPVPVRNVTERDALTTYSGLMVHLLDVGVTQVWTGTSWATLVGVEATEETIDGVIDPTNGPPSGTLATITVPSAAYARRCVLHARTAVAPASSADVWDVFLESPAAVSLSQRWRGAEWFSVQMQTRPFTLAAGASTTGTFRVQRSGTGSGYSHLASRTDLYLVARRIGA